MNSNRSRRIALTLGTAAGGLLAAAFLPMAVANADEFVYTPEPGQFTPDPSTDWGTPGLLSGATGGDLWQTADIGSGGTNVLYYIPSLFGSDNDTLFLKLISNDLFTVTAHASDPGALATGSVIDYTNFGLGYGNEFVDAAAGSATPGLTDMAITPFGDFLLF